MSSLETAVEHARRRYAEARPKTKALHESASQVMPGGNTRTVLYHGPFPIRIERGEGVNVHDVDGHGYVNLLGEYTAGLFGHSHPDILNAVQSGLESGVNLGAHSVNEAIFARAVCERFPDMKMVRFTNSGTEANMMAIGTARYVTQRSKVMVFKGGYHGGVLYFGGGGIPINAPFDYVIAPYNDTSETVRLIQDNADDLACVIFEPMLGSSGCIPADPGFLRAIGGACSETGSLMICDEVMTSRFWGHGASEKYGLKPDLMTLGKWVGGGMSFGAFGGREELMRIYDPSAPDALPHAGTFNNNALTMAAGIAALTQVFPSAIAEDLHRRGEAFRTNINALFERYGAGLQATGEGSLINIHGVRGPIRNADDLATSNELKKELVFLDLLEAGYYIARRGFIALPCVVEEQHITGFLGALENVLDHRKALFAQPSSQAA